MQENEWEFSTDKKYITISHKNCGFVSWKYDLCFSCNKKPPEHLLLLVKMNNMKFVEYNRFINDKNY